MNEDRTPHAWGKGRLLLLGLAILLIVVGPVILLQRLARDTQEAADAVIPRMRWKPPYWGLRWTCAKWKRRPC